MKKNTKEDAVKWYKENRFIYQQISKKVENLIKEIIEDEKIPVHEIYSRAKEIDSFAQKIEDPKYNDPLNQITDFSGIRIIVYVESDLDRITDIIGKHFTIDLKNSVDKRDSLGIDKVGYRSIHYVAKFKNSRIKLPEYKKFKDIPFEIQIRTILQHAWAEIEHDKDYKFSGVLPNELKRRFKVLSGVLELADREFNEIAKAIDDYANKVELDTKQGNLETKIDSTSLRKYLELKLSEHIKNGLNSNFPSDKTERDVLLELDEMGIYTLKDLDKIITAEFLNTKKFLKINENYAGVLRHAMIRDDANKYFQKAWNNHWDTIDKEVVPIIKKVNVDIVKILNKYGVEIADMH